MAQLVCALAVHGDLGRHRSVSSGGGSLRFMTDRTLLATVHPGEHGIITAVLWGASGWRESTRGGWGVRIELGSVRLGWLRFRRGVAPPDSRLWQRVLEGVGEVVRRCNGAGVAVI